MGCIFDLSTALHSICYTKTLRVKTNGLLQKKSVASLNLHGVSAMQTQFLNVLEAVVATVKKY